MSDNDFEIGLGKNQEWSHIIDSDDIGGKVKHIQILPPNSAISALCKRLNIHSIDNIAANITLQRNGINKVIHVNGAIKVALYQKCVITTEPVYEVIEDQFEAWFTDPNSAVSFAKAKRERLSRKEQNDLPIIDESEDPEAIIDGKIDLGELVVQHISLALNPYPKLKGAEHEYQDDGLGDAPEGTYDNPFAALKDWKDKERAKYDKNK